MTTLGPSDDGRRMSLDEFDEAVGPEGCGFELGRGIVTAVDVPHPQHFAQVHAMRRQFVAYDLAHPGKIHGIAGGGECKILVTELDSERHPDLAVYQTPPPEEDVWSRWILEIVIEVVSPSSRHRDYDEKPEEYFRFGVLEYWIVDAEEQEMRVLRRSRGRWSERTLTAPDVYQTRLLPGFRFECTPVFDAARP